MDTIEFKNQQNFLSRFIHKINLKSGIIIWLISMICSLIVMKLSNFNDDNFSITCNVLTNNLYVKIMFYLLQSILDILLIAAIVNIFAVLFKYKSSYRKMVISCLYLELISIFLFPIQVILLHYRGFIWLEHFNYFIGFIELILLIVIIKLIYQIKYFYKVILIGITAFIVVVIFNLFPFFLFRDKYLDYSINKKIHRLMSQENENVPLTDFTCEIPEKTYKSGNGNMYKIKGQAEVSILHQGNNNTKEYLCTIVRDCIHGPIYTNIFMSDHIDTLRLKKCVISQSNSVLVDYNVTITKLILLIE